MFSAVMQGLTTAANIASQQATNAMNYKIAKETNEMNYKIHQEDNQFNKDMWNLSNEYNDPSKHMERLLNAGINPMYSDAYGSDVSSPMSSANPIAMQPAQMNPLDFSGFADIQLKQAQADNLNADTEKKGADTEYTRSLQQTVDELREGEKIKIGSEIELNNSFRDLNKKQQEEAAERIENLRKEREVLQNQIETNLANVDLAKRELELKNKTFEWAKKVDLKKLELEEASQQIQWYTAIINGYLSQSQISLNKSTERLQTSQTDLNYANTGLSYANTENVNADTIGKEQDNAINEPHFKFAQNNAEFIQQLLTNYYGMSNEQYKGSLENAKYDSRVAWHKNSLNGVGLRVLTRMGQCFETIGSVFGPASNVAGAYILRGPAPRTTGRIGFQ